MIRENIIQWQGRELREWLEAGGWKTPQTYCKAFDAPGNFPAVYMFILWQGDTFSKCAVAYVGMSKRLLSRWRGHNILPDLEASPYWTQKWFKRIPEDRLREVEANYIKQFNPLWNINGCKRGVSF